MLSPKKKLDSREPTDRIFVCVVAYCDNMWPQQVAHILEQAFAAGRVRVGVLEFVRKADESCEMLVPAHIRQNVRVHTVSQRVATSMREARRTCLEEMRTDEEYILFARGFHAVRNWDAIMIEQTPEKGVLSAHLSSKWSVAFPCFHDDGKVKYKKLALSRPHAVPSLCVSFDFTFCASDIVHVLLESSNEWDVMSRLQEHGYSVFTPGEAVVKRSGTPRGVKAATRPCCAQGQRYAESVGAGTIPTHLARLGVTPDATVSELVAKFGSIVAARIEIQTVQAEQKKRL